MKVHILDAYFDTLRHLPSFARVTDPHDPVLSHPRVIPTPHIGVVAEDEFDLQFADIYDRITAFAEGAPIDLVNPDALSGTADR